MRNYYYCYCYHCILIISAVFCTVSVSGGIHHHHRQQLTFQSRNDIRRVLNRDELLKLTVLIHGGSDEVYSDDSIILDLDDDDGDNTRGGGNGDDDDSTALVGAISDEAARLREEATSEVDQDIDDVYRALQIRKKQRLEAKRLKLEEERRKRMEQEVERKRVLEEEEKEKAEEERRRMEAEAERKEIEEQRLLEEAEKEAELLATKREMDAERKRREEVEASIQREMEEAAATRNEIENLKEQLSAEKERRILLEAENIRITDDLARRTKSDTKNIDGKESNDCDEEDFMIETDVSEEEEEFMTETDLSEDEVLISNVVDWDEEEESFDFEDTEIDDSLKTTDASSRTSKGIRKNAVMRKRRKNEVFAEDGKDLDRDFPSSTLDLRSELEGVLMLSRDSTSSLKKLILTQAVILSFAVTLIISCSIAILSVSLTKIAIKEIINAKR